MKQPLLTIAAFCALSLPILAQDGTLLRYPAVHPTGSTVAFSYQGDIWTVPTTGGKATRLTIHEAYESNPVFSPDGKQIAFSGSRYGNNDLFVMDANGGTVKRLTFHSGADNISSWTQKDQIVFSTNREFRQIERPAEVHAISPNGGTEKRILDAVGHDPVISPNGRFIAFVRGDINPVAREDYRGSSNRELWIYDTQKKTYHTLPAFTTNDILPQWVGDSQLYFLSSEEGVYNLYKFTLDGNGKATKAPEQITKLKDEAIRAYSLTADGKMAVLEKDTRLYTLDVASGKMQAISVEISADDRLDPFETKIFTNGGSDFNVSPNGKLMLFAVRGEIFVSQTDKEKSRSVNISNHAFRDQDAIWLNDSTALYTSDRSNGNFDIYLVRSADSKERNLYKTLKLETVPVTKTAEDESSLVLSPDGKQLAYTRGRGTLVVADISADGKLTNEKILSDSWSAARDVVWSPDGKWLAYSMSDLYFNQEVFIQKADNSGKPVNVSMHPRRDSQPYWSADGSKLGFISERSVARTGDVWFVWLKKEDWEKATQDWQETEPETEKKPAKGNTKAIVIDLENIHERVVQVTNAPGDESNLLISKDGETFYYVTANTSTKGTDLFSIKWDGTGMKVLTRGGANPSNVTADKDMTNLYFTTRGSFNKFAIKAATQEAIPYQAKMKIDYALEREQVFEEAWRTIRDGFYDPKFHGYDWNKLKAKYKARSLAASTSQDFRDMFNLMLGELNASHMGLTVPDRAETQRESTGLLGAELVPQASGMLVKHVVPETPADKTASKLKEGDIILQINGQSVTGNANFYELLNGLANEKVVAQVQGADKQTREVVIRLTNSISDNLYQEWVNDRKKMVDKLSGGRLGYIHIRGMNFPSFEVVEREFTAAGYGKDGLVIDVRYNGGGSTTDYLMTILNYKQHAYTIPRGAVNDLEKEKNKYKEYYPIGERLVYAAWTKPTVALCNEGSYSNAEIFSHAYKGLGIGKLVGLPTNGSVISTGGKALMDGSFVRLPGRAWFTKGTDINQELGPAIPDIIVENEPNWISAGTDKQLETAVQVLMKDLK